jgi:osmoprotectant transport system permease protein
MTYLFAHLDKVAGLFLDHLYLVLISLLISICIATPISIIVSRFKKLQFPVISILGVIYTIPSLALFALMIPFIGLGFRPAVTALVAYSQMALVRNMVAGIKGIDPAVIEAAKGMGMGKWRIMRKIIIPLSLPVVVAGIRIATVSMIGIATIAAFINAGGLGKLIFEGIYQDHPEKIIAGTIAVAFLAIITELILRFIERKVSWKEKGKVA